MANIVDGLSSFYSDLKLYQARMEQLTNNRMIAGYWVREKNETREKLVREIGAYKHIVIELTEKQYFTINTSKYDMWDEAFNPSSEFPTPSNLAATAFCLDAVNEAIGKLEHDIESGTRDERGKYIVTQTSQSEIMQGGEFSTSHLFDDMHFHHKVIESSKKLFTDGHYRDAVYRAYVEVDNAVKAKTGNRQGGKQMMSMAFRLEKPLIQLNPLKTQSDRDEQEGFMHLFMGAMQGIRNPKGHENIIQNDPYKALKYLGFASLLMEIIDFWEAGS